MGTEDDIKKIEDELQRTKYNKATQGHIGKLKAKIAKLRNEDERKSGGKKGAGYGIKKSGDATVIMVGFPSVGKSTLLNQLTNADSKIGDYDFTTLEIIPGVLEYNGAKIQLLDVPGIISNAATGKGRGREILAVARNADLILILAASNRKESIDFQIEIIEKELYGAGFRLNTKPPDIKVIKKNLGGLNISSTVKLTKVSRDEIRSVLNEFGIYNADVLIRENVTVDRFIDGIMTNRIYVPGITIINKSDLLEENDKKKDFFYISALKQTNIDVLRDFIWDHLSLIRIFLKKIGKDPDLVEPLILREPATVKNVCLKLHRTFADNFKYARIWGSGKFPGQKMGGEYKLKDKDIVELHFT
ncbi:MAG: GTP-binding protein [Candidatus Aenigmatarchaeota archaeon]